MNLKNYTSSVPASTMIARIEGYLADCGVSGTTKEFSRGQPVALSFHIKLDGRDYTIRLPANVEAVQVQISLIKLKQVDFRQAFLAYFWDGTQTFYEQLQASKFKALPEST